MGNSLNDDVKEMQLFLKHAYIYFNYNTVVKEASKEHSSHYLKKREFYHDKMLYYLPMVFNGKSEREIYRLMLKVVEREL